MTEKSLNIGLQQRVLAGYRIPFFEMLSNKFGGNLSLFSGEARPDEMIEASREPRNINLIHAYNLHLFHGKYYLCWQIGMVQWLQSLHPDVLILEANPRYLSQESAINWMHQQKKPVIGWGLGAPPAGGFLSPLQKYFRNRFINRFDALITYSHAGAASYRAAGIPAHRIFVACNAVTPRPIKDCPERPEHFLESRATILFVGRLQTRKRIDYLIQACAALPEMLKARLWIVGDGPEMENLQNLAKNIYPQTEFFGARFGDELADLFRQADLFVLPGTGGLALQEAMSYGLPVVAAEADGTQADLVRPSNGWRIPPGDQTYLNKLLIDVLSDEKRLRMMGRESYRIVAEEINLENMTEVFNQAVQYTIKVWRDK
ncbi:MAG: glycosyltransferase [Anaerolineae bacterium]|nr:glycosyltransferase [Anaerolineae bacterium]